MYWMPFALLVLLTLGFLINGACVFWMSYKWILKKGIIDHKMKMEQYSTLTKPIDEIFKPN